MLDLAGDPLQAQVQPTVIEGLPLQAPMGHDEVGVAGGPAGNRGLAVDDEGVRVDRGVGAHLAHRPVGVGAQVGDRAGP
ncbi:hypothetical protein [Methylobacterium sp. Leaf456]|uniref:hypothetical protein n=1 Tax=Methylobacterium sp. Leaf456 TaxID=1736382 RepID=UPI0012E38008|nr:hypothetical protein [Methylobacterium sp. Leaf456]